MYHAILVPLDGSVEAARALDPACTLARHLDVELIAVTYHHDDDRERLGATVEAQLAPCRNVARRHLLEPLSSSVGAQLADLSTQTADALICMSSTGRGRSAAVLGSAASEVLDEVAGPLLLVGPAYETARFRLGGPMLAAIDGSDYSESIMDSAEAFTKQFGYDLEVVWVSDPKAARTLAMAQGIEFCQDADLEVAGVHDVATAAEAEGHLPVDYEVLHGSNPANTLIGHAATTEASLLAMATHNRRGLPRVLLGSTTADVVRGAPCPVLVVRPDGAA